MIRVFFDLETFYDKASYTLGKLSPIEYVLDERWETLGCGVAIEHEPAFLLKQDEIAGFLRSIKQPYAAISHNALFDACVLSYRYNIHPDGLLCTLSMARALLLHRVPNGRLSLANLLKFLGFPPKGEFIHNMSGKHWADLERDAGLLMAWTGYTLNDVEGCRSIFFHLAPEFPPSEALIMDRVIRMATQPKLHANMKALSAYISELLVRQHELLTRVNHERTELMSNLQFAQLLRELGVEPPTKISSTTNKETYAFAKSDEAFVALLEHDDPDVQTLVGARLGVKSTIEVTRSQRLFNIATCASNMLDAPLLPCPLRYSGAHTHRYSGDWKLNMQNLGARKGKEIRTAIIAPPGYTIVAVDAAQIEARLTAWLAGEMDLLQQFANGDDVYRNFAAEIFQVKDAREISKTQRFVGKTCILGLGFGMSAKKLLYTITNLARDQNIDISWVTPESCDNWVQVYRSQFKHIKAYWNTMGWVLGLMVKGEANGMQIGPCVVDGTTIISPGGLRLYYHDLHMDDQREYWYKYGQFTKKIYGGKMVENVVQHLDRQHVVEAGINTELRAREYGIPDPRVLLNVHDENVHCVPDEYAQTMALVALGEMRRNAPWAEGLPLNAEVKLGKNFGEMEEFTCG
jgi:DNA polymerase